MLDKKFQVVLWDYDISKLNYEDDIVFVRVLLFWDREHLKIIKNKLGKERFKQKLQKNISKLDKKTLNYWAKIFGLNLQNNQSVYEQLNKPIFTRSFG